MACVNDESRLSFSAWSSGRYLSSFSILLSFRGGVRIDAVRQACKNSNNGRKTVVRLCNCAVQRIHRADGLACGYRGALLCVGRVDGCGSPVGLTLLHGGVCSLEMGKQTRGEATRTAARLQTEVSSEGRSSRD